MKIIPLSTHITRDIESGNKLYNGKLDPKYELSELSDKNTAKYPDLTLEEAAREMANNPGYAIMPMDNLVIIDIDDAEPYNEIVDMLGPPEDEYTYIVTSDKGYAHYVFTPTEYFNNSKLRHTSRKKVRKIDVLQGKCFTWGYGAINETKQAPEGKDITYAQPIPDILVDYLVERLAVNYQKKSYSDSNYNQLYIGKELIAAIASTREYLTNYKDPDLGRAWEFFGNIAQHITPNRYKEDMRPDLFPDSLPHTVDAAEFIQSTVAKLLRDRSISADTIIDLLDLICTRFWSKPITYEHMMSKLSNLTTQSFAGITYNYDENLLKHPMVSINGGGFGKIYVDVEGNYHVETLTSLVNLGRFKRFRLNVQAKGNKYNNKLVIDKNEESLLKNLDLITIVEDITKPKGLNDIGGEIKLYNSYNKTVFHNIILGLEPEPAATVDEFPTFIKLMRNLTYDHTEYAVDRKFVVNKSLIIGDEATEQDKMIDNFLFFLSQKMKKMIYSPLIFQLNGVGGIGKGVFVDILAALSGGKFKFNLAKSNKQFNELSLNKMWGQQSEIPVTEENKEELKAVSGDKEKEIEAKGISSIIVQNIRTDFVETNNDKIFDDPRRFVLWQSFKAPDWNYDKTIHNITLELRRLCAYLRDIDPKEYNRSILTHSKYWNGNLLEDTRRDREDSFDYGHDTKLVRLLGRHKELTGREINDKLIEILGKDYWHELKKETNQLWIILYTPGVTDMRGNECTHTITVSMMKKKGIQTQRITKSKNYNKAVHRVTMELTRDQAKDFENIEDDIALIEE